MRSPVAEAMPPITKSTFPADAHALIYRPSPSVTMSARKRSLPWQLEFDRRSPLRIEPLIGWAEDEDPLAHVVLSFPSADAAVAYARRQGLSYTVLGSADEAKPEAVPLARARSPTNEDPFGWSRQRQPGQDCRMMRARSAAGWSMRPSSPISRTSLHNNSKRQSSNSETCGIKMTTMPTS
jgi:hypothetical protein